MVIVIANHPSLHVIDTVDATSTKSGIPPSVFLHFG